MGNNLIAALADLGPGAPVRGMLIDNLYRDQPDVLDAIREARKRGVPYAKIAETLSQTGGHTVSASALRNWLRPQGL
jgi:hypothetical protein